MSETLTSALCFASVVSVCLMRRRRDAVQPEDTDTVRLSASALCLADVEAGAGADGDNTSGGGGMVRSESEFSLGLNRSLSVADGLTELGLCDAGHLAVSLGRFVLYSSIAVHAAKHYLQSDGSSSDKGKVW